MGLIVTIVTGLVVGILAKLLMPGRDPGGIIVTILLGIAGSFVGMWLAAAADIRMDMDGWGPFIASVIGAIVLLLVYRLVAGRRM